MFRQDYNPEALATLLSKRIKRILMICSNYDAFLMREDGQIEARVHKEYNELNISNPPQFIWANSSDAAREILSRDADIDMIICMFNETDKGIFPLAEDLRKEGGKIPFVLLMHYSREIRRRIMAHAEEGIDFVFSWHGNSDLILAIIKLFEDKYNADNDILEIGVQAILLVEDSIRYYSTYLPELYKLILTQSSEFIKETLNEAQRRNRKRSRPKILLATDYTEAIAIYEKYKGNFLGVISDVGMVIHKGDSPDTEKLDAGIDIVNHIRRHDPRMPIIVQSSQAEVQKITDSLGVGFLKKYSRTLFLQLSDYIKENFGFGDLVFKDENGQEICRAANLKELDLVIDDVPDHLLVKNTARNMFSKWFFARGLFTLARKFRSEHHTIASEAREFLHDQISAYHKAIGRGVIAAFDPGAYSDTITFARVGDSSMGGKARGLAFLNKLVDKHNLSNKYPGINIGIPRTLVITTEFFEEFILENGLQYVVDSELSDDEILSEFVASRLPERLIGMLKTYLATVIKPLAIRSSSKLEDSNYQPFAGVYSTYMVPICENRDSLLRMVGKAIKSVYASAFYNGSRTYIQTTGNLHSEEKMAVIIQDICGSIHDGYYFPMLSGVARSINFYPIGNEKQEDGVVNMVMGLGKAVVEGGKTLRFNPKQPKKILQLSQPRLAMRDSQRNMFVLDMRPGAFKISRNEGINFAYPSVSDVVKTYPHARLTCSTYDAANDRMVPGAVGPGSKIVSFDAILKYGQFPLAKAISDIMDICRAELGCEVEMEFAADMKRDGTLSLRLLQVRPISQFTDSLDGDIDAVKASLSKPLIACNISLGVGFIEGVKHFAIVDFDKFDNLRTKEIAAEIEAVNKTFRESGEGYVLAGPGRWGSSDPNLGIPVSWSEISEARVIVECSIPGFQVEPSQGTHFFQNITSLGVGYLTMDLTTPAGKDVFDGKSIEKMACTYKGTFVNVYESPVPLTIFIDRKTGQSVIGL